MPSDRRRILELALESLENRKRKLDEEIAEITRELRGGIAAMSRTSARPSKAPGAQKRIRLSKEERLRISRRMKAYWENWRKKRR